jgi:predicted ATP-grasp superfamily ATP-dependent carboligase
VAVISDGNSVQCLRPLLQIVDPLTLRYIDSEPLVDKGDQKRAIAVAEAGINALPSFRGYAGLDLVLHESNPELDTVLDVNPRLTTSYGVQRRLSQTNLAKEILRAFDGA